MKRLVEIQKEIRCTKSQYNDFGNYNYRSCEDILVAAKPLLEKYGLVLTLVDDIVCTENHWCYICAHAVLMDAETKEVITETRAFAREQETKKGMDAAQVTGAASSYARKYALNGLFLLDDNKDADTNEYQGKQEEKPKKVAGKKGTTSANVSDSESTATTAKDVPTSPTMASSQQIQMIRRLCPKVHKDEAVICECYKVGRLEDLTAADAAAAVNVLKNYEAKL